MRTLIILFALLSHGTIMSQWSPISDYSGGVAYSVASFVINNTAYVGGGNPSKKDFNSYDYISDSWSNKGNIEGNFNRASPIAFSIDNKGYIGGGSDMGSGVTNTFYQYDPSNNTWSKKSDFPGGNKHSGFYASVNSKGYVICGSDGSGNVSDVWEYDPSLDKWTKKTSYPGGAAYWPAGFTIGNKIYVGTGAVGGTSSTDFYEYDPSADKWTKKSSFPGSSRHSATGFAGKIKGFIGGGANDSWNMTYTDFFEYDPSTDSWIKSSSLDFPIPNTAWSTAFVIGNDAYFGTGASLSGSVNPTSKFYKAQIQTISGISNSNTNSDSELLIFPNPVKNRIYIETNNDIYQIRIYDLLGVLVKEEINYNNGPIDVGDIQPGHYVLEAKNRDQSYIDSKRFFISR